MSTNDPIFIVGAHKSGTSLLRNIFDGHPELFVVPFETHVYQFLGHWINNPYRYQLPLHRDGKRIREDMINYIKWYNFNNNEQADVVLDGAIDEKGFEKIMGTLKEDADAKTVINTLVEAVYYSLHGKELPSGIRFVEKSVENGELVGEYKKLYPNARFIHILRNPYSNIVSIRKYRLGPKGKYPLLPRIAETIYQSFYYAYKNQRLYDNYMVMNYEDLTSNPMEHIKELCNFLSIEYSENLLKPTSIGRDWKGNSTRNTSFDGITKHSEKWKKEILPLEIAYINNYLGEVMEQFGYDHLRTSRGYLTPCKGESLKKYIYNRVNIKKVGAQKIY